jgi:glycosyltransferase involved in cell wall biosynthesis
LGNFLISKLGTHILGTSKQLIQEQGYFVSKFNHLERKAVYCGFDTSKFLGTQSSHFQSLCDEFNFPNNSRIILFVGRLDSSVDDHNNQKNPIFALDIARLCVESDPTVRMLMVGGGETVRKRLVDRVQSWGLADRILLVGQRLDVPRFMLGSHLFLLTSIAEGLGMVVVEAQAAGLRVLASDAVPRECEAIPGMVAFKSLDEGVIAWAETVSEHLKSPVPDLITCNQSVKMSPFSIENSVASLLNIYMGKIQ